MGPETQADGEAPRELRLPLALIAAATYGFLLTAVSALFLGRSLVQLGDWPLVSAGVAFALGGAVWWRFLSWSGPQNGMRWALLGWTVGLLLLAVHPVLGLDEGVLHVYAAWLGLHLSGIVVGRWRLGDHVGRSVVALEALGTVAGAALAAGFLWAGFGAVWPLLVFAVVTLAAWWYLGRVPDPERPEDPLRRFAPWGDGSRLPQRSGWKKVLGAPAVAVYLIVSWVLFLPFATVQRGILQLPWELTERFGYAIPDLTRDPLSALTSLVTAPLVNHDIIQLVYVTVLLLVFGVPFEAREGTKRFLVVFVLVGAVGALVAGVLLHVLYPDVSAHPVLETAWERTWSGGSAGAFGIMGGVAARARNPWPLLAFFAFWELNVGWWFLRSYTPAFHITALVAGFLLVRFRMRPIAHDERQAA